MYYSEYRIKIKKSILSKLQQRGDSSPKYRSLCRRSKLAPETGVEKPEHTKYSQA